MRNPTHYKTRYGLYRAVMRMLAVENLPLTPSEAWWVENAFYHCSKQFPDLLPQLLDLRKSSITTDHLIPMGER